MIRARLVRQSVSSGRVPYCIRSNGAHTNRFLHPSLHPSGLRGGERKGMLMERFCAYFYKEGEHVDERKKQMTMRESELEVVRIAAESMKVTTQTPGVYGEERREVLLKRMYDPEPPAPTPTHRDDEDGTGSDDADDDDDDDATKPKVSLLFFIR